MNTTNINTLHQYHTDFVDARSLPQEPQVYKLIWWGLAVIEILLSLRLMLGYFDANLTSTFTYVIYSITNYIMYPFTTALAGAVGDGSSGWITIVAIMGYFVLTITAVSFLKAGRSASSRIEHARALSRRKYNRYIINRL